MVTDPGGMRGPTAAELAEPIGVVLRTEPCHFSVRGAPRRRMVITTDPALLAWAWWNAAARARAGAAARGW